MAGASSVFPNRLAPPLGMGYTTRRKQTAAPGEWPAGKGVFMRVLEQLEPQGVFRFFEELCAIPHGSRNCQAVSDWCAAFARERGLECHQDQAGNVIIIQEATPGYEAAAPVILQGHLDMVCEKEPGCTKDMAGEGLDLLVEDGCVRAKGTTLGGDDGIAVAMALAILDDQAIPHPRLEVVLTTDEEIGMLGAEAIDLSMLKGHKLLNIDSDVEGHFLTSCAGGMTVETTIPVDRMSQNGLAVTLTVTGLCGGHSGSEIDKEHANANMVMGRVLKYVSDRMELGVVTLEGGLKDNAIPRECTADLLIPEEKKEELTTYIKELTAELKKEYAVSDAGITIDCAFGEKGEASILSYTAMARVIFYLRHVPNGVQHMSTVMPGLVETSLNLGILKLEDQALLATSSVRSSVSSRKEDLRDRLEHIAEFLGGEIAVSGDYPAWEYQAKSEIRDTISAVYEELFQEEPVFEAIHAGLECGILSGKIKDLDCVSFGPNNYDIHTPKERLSISSTEKVWKLLVAFLKKCK